MNYKIFQAKTRVNPTTQIVVTGILCTLSTIALITWIMVASSGVFDINIAFLMERFMIYASLPLLIFAPFDNSLVMLKRLFLSSGTYKTSFIVTWSTY